MKKSIGSGLSRAYLQLTTPKREYNLVDTAVVAYCGFVMLVQILLQISPFMTFLATTPLYSIQTYLGLLGGALIVVDFFTTKKIWQGKYSILLYAILALAAVASIRMISYGMKENLFKLCWAAVQFVLMYSCAYRMDREALKRFIKVLFFAILLIWFVGCCISLYQYVNQIGYMYVVNPLAKDSSSNRQGFYDNRLFGIFYTLNHAAYISLLLILVAVAYFMWEKRWSIRVPLIVAITVLLFHIILSGSRSAFVSMCATSAVITWFAVRSRVKVNGLRCFAISSVAAVLAVAVCVSGFYGLKKGLSYVPYLKEKYAYQQNEAIASTENTMPEGTMSEDPTPVNPTEGAPELNKDLLVRDDLGEDTSNGRLAIWKDYISLYGDIGLVGLSPGNYMPYILENHPQLYVVEYIRVNAPDKYESGIIHHVHSGYMMVYVSTGLLGFLCLAAFIALCLIRVVRIIMKNKQLSCLFIGAFALVLTGAIAAVFDEGLFFQNNPHTTLFWFALGILLKEEFAQADEVKMV